MKIKAFSDPVQKGMCQSSIILGVLSIVFCIFNHLFTAILSVEGMIIAYFSKEVSRKWVLMGWVLNIIGFSVAFLTYFYGSGW